MSSHRNAFRPTLEVLSARLAPSVSGSFPRKTPRPLEIVSLQAIEVQIQIQQPIQVQQSIRIQGPDAPQADGPSTTDTF